jgi:CheY-like chemotaxis protein
MGYILLVEDNQSNADMIIRILETAGYEVRHYIKGLDGAQAARRERPALILMDFDLPDVDGRTMSLVLKKQLGVGGPKIIAVTARTGDNEMRIAERFGCDAFISKPFTHEQLTNAVKQFILQDNPTKPKPEPK